MTNHINTLTQVGQTLGIRGIDHIEFYVGNPRHTAHFYQTTFGLRPIAYMGSETGAKENAAYVVSNGDVHFVMTGALTARGPVAEYVRIHGDGVHDIAFTVDSADTAYDRALRSGAEPIEEPKTTREKDRSLRKASVRAIGDVIHSFIERAEDEWFLPGMTKLDAADASDNVTVNAIDHVAVSLPPGALDAQVDFYKRVMGFSESHHEYVTTGVTAMRSKVVESHNGQIKIPLLEPALAQKRSQIAEYLASHGGPGVQHVALLSSDILSTVATLRSKGLDFLTTPKAYYDKLVDRVGRLQEDVGSLRDLNILVDRDEWGYLMQIFSKPMQARPTFFVEIIQRKGGRGFGSGNIKALFEAVEREQLSRDSLEAPRR